MKPFLLGLALLILLASGASAADLVRLGKAGGAWTFLAADVGVKEGIYARYGIALRIADFAGDAKLQQAMASNGIDFGLGSGPAMAFAAKGAPVIAVAAFANQPRDVALVVPAASPLRSPAGLKGKLIAISTAGSLTEWLVKRVSSEEGWGTDGIRTAATGDAAGQMAALLARQVDGAMVSTESGIELQDRGQARILADMGRFAPHFITHVIFARRALVVQNPDLVRRFLKGFFASLAYIRTHKAETARIGMPLRNETFVTLSKAQDLELPMMIFDGTFDPQGLAVLKQSFVDLHILPKVPPDSAILTREFVPVQP